VGDVRYGGKS